MAMHPALHRQHVVEMLPAYALLALPDADLRRVEAHLSRCAECRAAFARTLEAAADEAGAVVARPSADARAAFLARTGGLRLVPASLDRDAERVRLLRPAEPARRPVDGPAEDAGSGRRYVVNPYFGMGLRAAAAMMLVIVLPIAGWFVGFKAELDERSIIFSLMTNPAAAHPLDDSDMQSDVSGVLYADLDANTGYLAASGLPPIPDDRRYQVWLMTPSEKMISAGFLDVSPDGNGEVLLRTPAPIGDYLVAVVTAEPELGSPEPTAPRTLGGWISG
jgi:hypothetical protein